MIKEHWRSVRKGDQTYYQGWVSIHENERRLYNVNGLPQLRLCVIDAMRDAAQLAEEIDPSIVHNADLTRQVVHHEHL